MTAVVVLMVDVVVSVMGAFVDVTEFVLPLEQRLDRWRKTLLVGR
jgi:hypothetical protein